MHDAIGTVRKVGRRAFTTAEKYAVNVPMRRLIDRDMGPDALSLLETTGRRSGRPHRTPVGNGLIGDTFWIIAERGLDADYVRNIQADPNVAVKVGGRWRSGTALVLPDDDVDERVRTILQEHRDLSRRVDAKLLDFSVAVLGSTRVTVRVDLEPLEANTDAD